MQIGLSGVRSGARAGLKHGRTTSRTIWPRCTFPFNLQSSTETIAFHLWFSVRTGIRKFASIFFFKSSLELSDLDLLEHVDESRVVYGDKLCEFPCGKDSTHGAALDVKRLEEGAVVLAANLRHGRRVIQVLGRAFRRS